MLRSGTGCAPSRSEWPPPRQEHAALRAEGVALRGPAEAGWSWTIWWLPNGSSLSCGASAGGRKRPALRYELVGAQTYASFESRPRQLQALVRPHGHGVTPVPMKRSAISPLVSVNGGASVMISQCRRALHTAVSATKLAL